MGHSQDNLNLVDSEREEDKNNGKHRERMEKMKNLTPSYDQKLTNKC